MCGIAGFIDFTHHCTVKQLHDMTDALEHRGPDGAGYWFQHFETATVGFGHRRLSILDLSTSGQQPMHSKCGRYHIVFNGEIYNFREIRETLTKMGIQFHSDCDTEVILYAFKKWGINCVSQFIGMFAIAIFDSTEQKLTLLRDRAGVKPLYYYWHQGLFLFASELKAFSHIPQFKKTLNMDAVSTFLSYSYIPAPHSIFANAHKIKSGHYAELDLNTQNFWTKPYWDVVDLYQRPLLDISYDDAKLELESLLKKAFSYRLVSDVPVGMFLSGGYDSTAVTALLQNMTSTAVKTFTIGFEFSAFNEAVAAKKIAQYLGTDHTEYYCTETDLLNLVDQIPTFCDEPFGDSSIVPTMLVSQLAKKQVTVSLSADGADELFCGYRRYYSLEKPIRQTLSHPNLASILRRLTIGIEQIGNASVPEHLLRKLRLAKQLLSVPHSKEIIYHILAPQHCSFNEQRTLLLSPLEQKPKTDFNDIEKFSITPDFINAIMAIDYKMYMQEDILTKVDRATMHCSLEGREPFLDQHIVDFASRLPVSYKYHQGQSKRILKDIVHNYIPKALMDRPKQGFMFPIDRWMKTSLKPHQDHYLSESFVKSQGLFSPKAITTLQAQYNAAPTIHNATRLWHLLMFNMWWEKWM